MTALDPTYARRLRRAIEDALTRVYGREAALRMIREAGRRSATAPESDSTGVVVGGDFHAPQLGGNHYGKTDLDGRDAAR